MKRNLVVKLNGEIIAAYDVTTEDDISDEERLLLAIFGREQYEEPLYRWLFGNER